MTQCIYSNTEAIHVYYIETTKGNRVSPTIFLEPELAWKDALEKYIEFQIPTTFVPQKYMDNFVELLIEGMKAKGFRLVCTTWSRNL
jgi:hypothetical protein